MTTSQIVRQSDNFNFNMHVVIARNQASDAVRCAGQSDHIRKSVQMPVSHQIRQENECRPDNRRQRTGAFEDKGSLS